MKQTTSQKFNQFLNDQAELNGVEHTPGTALSFAVAPAIEQKFIETLSESTDFLKSINLIGVNAQIGESLGLDIQSPIASRTNTETTDRSPTNPTAVNARDKYTCMQTNFDTFIRYATVDAWAAHPDFQLRINNAIINRMAQDKIMIGFNGTSAAAATSITTNPLLQDVNTGWLQKIRGQARRYMKGVNVYAGGTFNNIDACVFDAVNNLLDPWFKADVELVVYASRDIVNAKYLGIFNKSTDNVNLLAGLNLHSDRPTIAGLPIVDAPYLPNGTILVTASKNLSIYTQEGSMRKTLIDNAKRDRIETYASMNDGYVVEDFGRSFLIEGIKLSATA